MLKIFPILAILTGHVSGVVVTVPEKTVNVTTGGNATLLCTYTNSGALENFFIQWSFYSAKESQLHTSSPCHDILSMDEKSVSHCQKMVYVTDARGRCSWRYKILVSQRTKTAQSVLLENYYIYPRADETLQFPSGPKAPVSDQQPGRTVTTTLPLLSTNKQIYYYSGGQSYSYGEFKNRITAATSPGNASITISNMQPSDTGSYTCEVFSPQGDAGQSQKSVIVNVLVKPSKPFCKIEGTPERGHLIYLLCNCEEGLPRPTYRWYKIDDNTLKPVTEQFNPSTGILYIGNLTTFETGYYRCIASNSLGNSTCELDLSAKYSDSGVVAGALIGAILVAAIICVVVWVLTKKAKKRKSSSNEMQEMAPKQPNAEYVQVPNEENIPATTVPSSNATNEYPSVDETPASGTPGNDEKQEAEKEEVA